MTFKLEEYKDVVYEESSPFFIMFRSDGDKDEDYMAEYEESARENQGIIYYAY